MTATEAMWLELELGCRSAAAGTQTVFRRLRPECRLDLFASIACVEGIRFFQVLLPRGEPCPKLTGAPKMDGIELRARLRKETYDRASLELCLTQPALADVFTILVNDLAGFLSERVDRSSPLEILIERLSHWQKLLRSMADGLAPERRRGLVGELWMLRRLISIMGAERALRSWSGPSGSDQDFQLERLAIEVKTSVSRQSGVIGISSERQLDAPPGVELFLTCWHVDERLAAVGDSLPSVVMGVRGELGVNATAQARFEVLLALGGYLERDALRYDQPRYTVRSETTFRIVEGFPRIVERGIPKGLGKVRYDIAFEAMRPFAVLPGTLESLLEACSG